MQFSLLTNSLELVFHFYNSNSNVLFEKLALNIKTLMLYYNEWNETIKFRVFLHHSAPFEVV